MKLLVATMLAVVCMVISVYAQEIPVYVNARNVEFSGALPVNSEGRVFVPVRDVFEAMGFDVVWDDDSATVYISNYTHVVSIRRGDDFIVVNDKAIYPDVPAQIIDGWFMLPLRAIAQAVGADVQWTEEGSVTIRHIRPRRERLHGWERWDGPPAYDDLLPLRLEHVEVEVLDFVRGVYRLTVTAEDVDFDPRGTLWFFWASDYGTFSEAVYYIPDYASVVFSARPGTDNQNVTVVIGVSDRLGQVHRRGVVLKGNDIDPDVSRYTEQEIFNRLNDIRAENDLPPLIWHEGVAEAMREHNRMIASDVMGTGLSRLPDNAFDTITPVRNAGIEFTVHNRMSATSRATSVDNIVAEFTRPGRIEDILNPALTHIGIAVFYYSPTDVFSRQVLIGE